MSVTETMSVPEGENVREIRPAASFDTANLSGVSVQHVNNQEGLSEDTDESTVQLSVQCVENQRGLHGQIVYDKHYYTINLQPLDEPDMEDEGIITSMEED